MIFCADINVVASLDSVYFDGDGFERFRHKNTAAAPTKGELLHTYSVEKACLSFVVAVRT